jgi:putative phosphoesterase
MRSAASIPTIYGNYDYAIARDLEDCGCAYVTPHDRELGQQSVDWTLAHTAARSKRFMRDLPFDLRFEVGERNVHLVHGSPRKVNEYLFEDKPARLYERLAAAEEGDVLVFGHTHKPWVHEYGGVLFVNCGSVGKPKDGDPRGAFAVLEAEDDRVRVRAWSTTPPPSRARSRPSASRASSPTSSSSPPDR